MVFDSRLRSPKEQLLFVLGAIFSAVVWAVMAVSIVGIFYAALIAFGVFVAHSLFLAHIRGNGLRIHEGQQPQLYARCQAAAQRLGLPEVPEIYVVQSGGTLNAFATKLLSRRFVILLSDLVDHCQSDKQLDFIIGHEMGHLAAGHLRWRTFLAPFFLLPWLGPAYSRACEYTCDRCGHAVSDDLEQSQRALVLLAAGGKLAARADLHAYMEQSRETGGFFMAIYELVSSHPFLCKRAAALQAYARAERQIVIPSRNPFAYPFAPLLGISVGGASSLFLVALIYLGILGAALAPAVRRYLKGAEAARQTFAPGLGLPAALPTAQDPYGLADPMATGDEELGAREAAEEEAAP